MVAGVATGRLPGAGAERLQQLLYQHAEAAAELVLLTSKVQTDLMSFLGDPSATPFFASTLNIRRNWKLNANYSRLRTKLRDSR